MGDETFVQNIEEDELNFGNWLVENEDLKGTIEYAEMKSSYDDIMDYNMSPAGIAKKVMKYGAGELGSVYDAAGRFVSNPVESTKNFAGGLGDVATTAFTSFAPESMVNNEFAFLNDPDSLRYKRNEFYKNNPYVGDSLSFMATKPREQYEAMGKQMGEHFGGVYDKLTDSPESAVKLLSENPLESLLNFSGLLGLTKVPIQAGGLLNNKIGKIVDNITNQSPTSLISAVPQILRSKANKAGVVEAGKQLTADAVIKKGVAAGYNLPPSAYKGTGIMNKIGRIIEETPFTGNTAGKVVIKNQATTDRLMRKFLNIADDVPFEDVLSAVQARSGAVYKNIGKLKGVKKSTKETSYVDGKIIGADGKYNQIPNTNIKTKVLHRDGSKILKDLKSSRDKQNKLFKKGKYDDGIKQGEITAQLNKELLELAKYHKNPTLVKKLDAARVDYAKAYSVFPYVSDGSVNASAFAKANRYNTQLTGEGKIIRDFANVPRNKKYLNIPVPKDGQNFTTLEKYAMGAAVVADASSAGLVGLAGNIIPSLLTSRKLGRQDKFMNPNYGANGLLETLGNPTTVRNAALIPSLLNSSQIEDLPYLKPLDSEINPEMETIDIVGGGNRFN